MLADRVIVLDGGVVRHDARVELDGRRSQADPAFARLRARLLTELGVEDDHDAVRHATSTATATRRRRGRPRDLGPTAAPQPVHLPRRPPRGGLAAPGQRARPRSSTSPTTRSWPSGPRQRSSTRSSSPTVPALADEHPVRRRASGLEPITLLTAIAAATERIGLIAHRVHDLQRAVQPGSPVRLARPLSAGAAPAGTSSPPVPPTPRSELRPRRRTRRTRERYERAEEFVDVVTKLWDSWEDDAVVADRESGHLRRPDKIHRDRPRRQALPGAGPAQRAARRRRAVRSTCRPASSEDGRALRRPLRRGDLHRAPDARDGAGVLRRHQAPGPGASAATREHVKVLPGHQPVHRRHARPRPRTCTRSFNDADPAGVLARPAAAS